MTITTHAELITAVQNWTHRASLASARIDEFIDLAESRIRKELRTRDMETESDVTVSARTAPLPTNYRGLRRVYLDTSPAQEVRFVTPDYYWATWMSSTTGKPKDYTIEAGNFVFGPPPDTTYTAKVLGLGLAALTASVTPALFTTHPDLYLYGTLVESAPFLGNTARLPEWEGKYQVALSSARTSNIKDRFPGPLIRRPLNSVV